MKKHQAETKYCLSLQRVAQMQQQMENNVLTNSCHEHPKKEETQSLSTSKLDTNIEQQRLKAELDELKALVNGLSIDKPVADNPSNIDPGETTPDPASTVNNVQQMEPVTIGKIADAALVHLDLEIIEQGIEAIAEFTARYPLNGNVICMDRARRKFKYVNEAGDLVIDFGGTQLSKLVFRGIKDRCTTLIDDKYELLMNTVQEAVSNDEGYKDEIWDHFKAGSDLQDLRAGITGAAEGTENEFQRAFVRKLAKKL